MVEGNMRKINMMTWGPRLIIYLPNCLSIIHFLCVSLEIEGTRGLFCGTAPLSYSWVSFHATRVPCMFLRDKFLEISVTHATQWPQPTDHTVILCGHVFDLGMP